MLKRKVAQLEELIAASKSEVSFIEQLLTSCFELGLPIAIWQLPRSQTKRVVIDLSGNISRVEVDLEQLPPGFVVSPFLNEKRDETLFIKGDIYYSFEDEPRLWINPQLNDAQALDQFFTKLKHNLESPETKIPYHTNKAENQYQDAEERTFVQLVENAVNAMERGEFNKVVLSRKKSWPLNERFNPITNFLNACERYPNAFVSFFSIPELGTWMGASPELLVSMDKEGIFHTVALAGTQPASPDLDLRMAAWTMKEIEEQAFVSRYIINCFKKIRLREFEEDGPKTVRAGNLIHLKTDMLVDTRATNFPQLGTVMLGLLHPTSAVCGIPKQPALAFINHHEQLDRSFFAGFLGPVNVDEETYIHVNLRCAQFHEKEVTLYAGAGITSISIPENEWHETGLKFQTLLNVLSGIDQ